MLLRTVGVPGSSASSGRTATGVTASPHRTGGPTCSRCRPCGTWGSTRRARRLGAAVGLVRDQVTWGPEFGNSPFFEGEVEPCINGRRGGAGRLLRPDPRPAGRPAPGRAAHGRWLELRGGAGLRALLVPHHDLRSGRTPGVREGQRRHGRGDGGATAGTGVPARASPVPEVVIRRGDRAPVDAVHVPDHVALRRAEGSGLLAQCRCRTRRAGGRGRRVRGEAAKSGWALAAP